MKGLAANRTLWFIKFLWIFIRIHNKGDIRVKLQTGNLAVTLGKLSYVIDCQGSGLMHIFNWILWLSIMCVTWDIYLIFMNVFFQECHHCTNKQASVVYNDVMNIHVSMTRLYQSIAANRKFNYNREESLLYNWMPSSCLLASITLIESCDLAACLSPGTYT